MPVRGNGAPRGLPGFTAAAPIVSVRGGKITYVVNSTTVAAALPSGTIAGDILVAFGSHGYGMTAMSGGTLINSDNAGGQYWKVATATDVANGYVTCTFAGGYYGECGIVAIKNAPNTSSPVRCSGSSQTTGASVNVSTTGSGTTLPVGGDLVLYWSGCRKDGSSGMTITMPGTVIDSRSGLEGGFSAYVSWGRASAGSNVTFTGTWSARDINGQHDGIVIIKSTA